MSYYGRECVAALERDMQLLAGRTRYDVCACGFRHPKGGECGADVEPPAWPRRRSEKSPLPLTDKQRFLIFRGAHPRLAFPAKDPAPVEPGFVRRLSPQLEVEVLSVKRSKNAEQWELEYVIHDHRATLLRRVPPVTVPPSDKEGPVPPPSRGDVETARLDSSYTHTTHGAVPDAGDAVPDVDHNLIVMAARTKWANRPRTEDDTRADVRRVAARLKSTMIALHRAGGDPTERLARIERELGEMEAESRRAA